MREILFRGKRKDNGEWVYGFYIKNELFDGRLVPSIIPVDEKGVALFDDGYDIEIKVNPETVGQDTGLKDLHGKYIFEGDIVKVYDVYCNETVVGVVEFCDGSFRICDKDFKSYDRWMYCRVEVISNIHDNPELLEVKQ